VLVLPDEELQRQVDAGDLILLHERSVVVGYRR
jgi:hypothetical protein